TQNVYNGKVILREASSYFRVEVFCMVRPALSRFFNGVSFALLLVLSGFIIVPAHEAPVSAVEPSRAASPEVNRTEVEITLYEGFEQFSGQFFYGTGKGSLDLFFDPNYNWIEGEIPYPHKAFEVTYPWGYDKSTTPIEVTFVTSHYDTHFAMATVKCKDNDFNSYIYGQDHYKVTVTAWNSTGSSNAELWFQILNVNDPPTVISEKDFYSIAMDEDSYYEGINKDHDQLDDIFGDNRDKDDTLTFTYEPMNDLASPDNIEVDLDPDGSSVVFTPKPDWACPYVPTSDRLKGRNYRPGGELTWSDFFAHFRFNCSDLEGAYVKGDLYVYVGPLNDVPVMQLQEHFYVNEDTKAVIQFTASDVDPVEEQVLRYGTNITSVMYEHTGVQLEFTEGYVFDTKTGKLEFNTENKMVGDYPVAAWVNDRPSEELGTKGDYPVTPYRVYSNFTLHIVNRNDPPVAIMDSPTETFIYNTITPVELNATRTADPDQIHGQILTYRWYVNGEAVGEGVVTEHLFEKEGEYDIELNVTDGEFFSTVSRKISVEKTRILGEIFEGKNIDQSYVDNASEALVLHRNNQNEMFMEFDSTESVDIRTLDGYRDPSNPNMYKIKVVFGKKMEYLFTEYVQQEPVLNIYFLKPDFVEDKVAPKDSDIPTYTFPVPTSNYRYNKIQFDLRQISVIYYPIANKVPAIRQLDTDMGVEITLTIAELDQMNIDPDFVLYVTADMKTTVTESSGKITIINSWDAAGFGAKVPQVDAGTSDDDGNGKDGINPLVIVIVVIIILVIVIVLAVLLFLLLGKKPKKEEPPPVYSPPTDRSLDDMIFGSPPQGVTAEQMYGPPQPQGLSQGPPPEELPPVQPQDQGGSVTEGPLPDAPQ
ncbi:MAG: PKD domain-containing protein, partial [Candidatus Thermoplasmatota archaeon]|nr:PKD domain-containing protein [Candidatus Thermoplasmatota archaeon]